MYLWYFQCCSVTAWKVPRWFCDSLGIICLWLIWWVWRWCGNVAERLQRPEGVNISKGRVRAECMERSHMAVENTREHWRMLGMKFYVTPVFWGGQLTNPVKNTTLQGDKMGVSQVPPHNWKRIFGILRLPWYGTKMVVFIHEWLRPKGKIIRTIVKIRMEEYVLPLHGGKENPILIWHCTDEFIHGCSGLPIKWPNRYCVA